MLYTFGPMVPCFDCIVRAPLEPAQEEPYVPEGLAGAIFFGPASKQRREEFERWLPRTHWRHAEELDKIVGETNARFPSRSAEVVDLTVTGDELDDWLRSPTEWWPLCESLRGSGRMLRLHLPEGAKSVAGAKQIVRRYYRTRFWIDPFVFGPAFGWQGHVRLAQYENVYLTTCGLFPGEGSPWSPDAAEEALRFVVGEVGASVLLYGSGLAWEQVADGLDRPVRAWLSETKAFDDDERKLVLEENAKALFERPTDDLTADIP